LRTGLVVTGGFSARSGLVVTGGLSARNELVPTKETHIITTLRVKLNILLQHWEYKTYTLLLPFRQERGQERGKERFSS